MEISVNGVNFDEVPACSDKTVEEPVLLFIFIQHFDMIDAMEHNELDLFVFNYILNDDVVGFANRIGTIVEVLLLLFYLHLTG